LLTQLLLDLAKLLKQDRIPEFNIRAAEGFVAEMRNRILAQQEYHDSNLMQFATEVSNLITYASRLYALYHPSSHQHRHP
jgi:hypothetical protein